MKNNKPNAKHGISVPVPNAPFKGLLGELRAANVHRVIIKSEDGWFEKGTTMTSVMGEDSRGQPITIDDPLSGKVAQSSWRLLDSKFPGWAKTNTVETVIELRIPEDTMKVTFTEYDSIG